MHIHAIYDAIEAQCHDCYLVGGKLSESDITDIISALKEVTNPHQLGTCLQIERYILEKLKQDRPLKVERQKIEVIRYWLRNNVDCTWGALANAVEIMGKRYDIDIIIIYEENYQI